MADIGFAALALAFAICLYSAAASAIGKRTQRPQLAVSTRNGVYAAFGLVTLASIALLYAILSHDFEVKYVASYTSRDASLFYTLSAFWAGNAGSLLFWTWVLSIFGAIVVFQNRKANKELMPYASSVVMVTLGFFLLVLLFISNPFAKQFPIPADGVGLNPLLENPGMVFHPPTLLIGYVGFTIPFAFAIAALLAKKVSDGWVTAIRRWTLFSWGIRGVGTILGAWWAYVELGWGGYWAWDAVENASLMPWLVATALVHSILVQRRRGIFKVWNMVLIIITFNLILFGTFLTRSGVISSVHTFSESLLGWFFLGFIGLSVVVSVWLLATRYKSLRSEAQFESQVSRESGLRINNFILVGATAAILIGTMFPLLSEVALGNKTTLSPSFFNQMISPILLIMILGMGIISFLGWRRSLPHKLTRSLIVPAAVAVLLALILAVVNIGNWYGIVAFSICGFALSAIVLQWSRDVVSRHRVTEQNYLRAFTSLFSMNNPRFGAAIVHLAIIIIAIGVIGSSGYASEKEASLSPGEQMTIAGYSLTFQGLNQDSVGQETTVKANLAVQQGGSSLGTMTPKMYRNISHPQWVAEVAIKSTLARDLYVSLGDWDEQGRAVFKATVNPLVIWIWIGGAIFVLGTIVVFWPDRLERRARFLRRSQGRELAPREIPAEDNEHVDGIGKRLEELEEVS
jgi:cytochrome c-type biogenesis protein CcmF